METISLIIPSKNREKLFLNCIDSLNKFTKFRERIEILVVADDNDPATQQYVKDAIMKFMDLNIKLLVRTYSDALNEDYYNWAAGQAKGSLILIFADDLEITAPNWDESVYREVESYTSIHPDRIFTISLKDNTPSPSHRLPKFACFPMFTREAIEALGFAVHPKPKNWGVDYINHVIFDALDRILKLHDRNYLNHISYHTKQVECDATAIRIGEIFNSTKMIPHHNTDRILWEECPVISGQLKDKIKAYYETKTSLQQ